MRYTKIEEIWLVGRLPSGDSVIIEIYDLSDGSAVSLTSDVCSEIGSTGLYRWSTSNLTSQPDVFTQYVYTMIDQYTNDRYDGKIVLGDPDKVKEFTKVGQTWINTS